MSYCEQRRQRQADAWEAMRTQRTWVVVAALGKAMALGAPVGLMLGQALDSHMMLTAATVALGGGIMIWIGFTAVVAARAGVTYWQAFRTVWLVPTWTLLEVFTPVH